jgi:hypothetical protein
MSPRLRNRTGRGVMFTEEWRAVPGWDGFYSVSSFGRVRSESRQIIDSNGDFRKYKCRILKPCADKDGYLKVRLSKDDVQKKLSVHHIVLAAYHGPRSSGLMARHLNGKPNDNSAQNLAWGTALENKRDQITHNRWGHKLTEDQARDILSLRNVIRQTDCAMLFDVDSSYICRIWNRRSWSWL